MPVVGTPVDSCEHPAEANLRSQLLDLVAYGELSRIRAGVRAVTPPPSSVATSGFGMMKPSLKNHLSTVAQAPATFAMRLQMHYETPPMPLKNCHPRKEYWRNQPMAGARREYS